MSEKVLLTVTNEITLYTRLCLRAGLWGLSIIRGHQDEMQKYMLPVNATEQYKKKNVQMFLLTFQVGYVSDTRIFWKYR